ncbi:hypothetical protein MGN01_38100 [Methylobacterium gnaphalii]|uniref:Uncharacterized protein n=1 Tax=Methylobacterium gnaphalii TaxID=1010610 RepID=A0A512JPS8_9HYPH|nr:hypothetical protein MGN01_38100 [Methylobacterium gnaphalii]GLS49417.1 hypothetical protein GCM10007885_22650 [Methylobacterium gnaphalii]
MAAGAASAAAVVAFGEAVSVAAALAFAPVALVAAQRLAHNAARLGWPAAASVTVESELATASNAPGSAAA